jgi:uncharacterized protein (TIGR00159 family)
VLEFFRALFSQLTWVDVLDILIVTLIIYAILVVVRGTRADQILQGLAIVLLVSVLISTALHLTLFGWLLRNSIPALLLALPVIFQPELRRLLEYLGRSSRVVNLPGASISRGTERTVEEICQAVTKLKERRHPGALLCIERSTGLQDYAATGVRLEALVSAELLLSIFYPNSPLHDGAVIIRGDRLVAARVLLPLSEAVGEHAELGTRHRAALGLSEQTDAVVVVVSEQTGKASLAEHGRLVQNVSDERLRRVLLLLRDPGRRGGRRRVATRLPSGLTGALPRDAVKSAERP